MSLATAVPVCAAVGAPGNGVALAVSRPTYYWNSVNVGDQAQLITLFCRGCGTSSQNIAPDVPLISAMRDTAGDESPDNDRLTAVWLLSYVRPGLGKRMLSAIPFFYWRVSGGSQRIKNLKTPKPLLDMTTLQHPIFNAFGRDALQWGLLDSSLLPIRASSRAYRTNESDDERLHLEEAESYLRDAPLSPNSPGLSATEINTLIARLELRKTLLGGLASEAAAKRLGEETSIRYEVVRTRNWELLRQCADKTGLYFEPLPLAATSGEYALLWFPLSGAAAPANSSLRPIWKLLGIKNPWEDASLRTTRNDIYWRSLDEAGNLLPLGSQGAHTVQMVPLGVYSLTYPNEPLLVLDFRTSLHLRWHEISQRSINEITTGVIGISHFTNWYYYVAADMYNFIASRHGAAVNQSERLDSYSQFRVQLQLDRNMDARLRQEMQQRVGTLAINPLESNPQNEMQAAATRYSQLQKAAANGTLLSLLSKDRRAELAQDRESSKQIQRDNLVHLATLGLYTHRAKASPSNAAEVASYRRVQHQLNFLDALTSSGTKPEVAYQSADIQHSIQVLQEELPSIGSRPIREHARAALQRVNELSDDEELRADCNTAMASIESLRGEGLERVALQPAAVHASSSLGVDTLR